MAYVDGVMAAVPGANNAACFAPAKAAMVVFKDHGCLGGHECWSDDVPVGKRTDFWRAVAAEPGEAVLLSWLIWPDKATRDAGMAKVFADPRMARMQTRCPSKARG